jgi:2-oxoglutarate ferredoxin oxidoreductase subunit alpha
MVPLHGDAIVRILENSRRTILIENNYSGQFARYLRSETSFVPDGFIRKYDGEPFMPHHIVEAVKEQLAGAVTLSVPMHEITV